MHTTLSTIEVCAAAGVSEPALRHILRRPGAPRPAMHPTAHVFLWTAQDVADLIDFMRADNARPKRARAKEANR